MAISPPLQNEDTFHKARSRLIDAYARFEERLVIALDSAKKPVKGDTLASKLKTLRTSSDSDGVAEEIFERLLELVQFRADLVHSPMAILDRDGERLACFRNAREAASQFQAARLVSYKTLKSMADEIDQLSSALISN